MPLVDAFEVIILDGIIGDPDYTPPTNWFVGLSTTTPTEAGGNFTEPVGNAYARVSTADANWGAATGTAPVTKANSAIVTFPTATPGSWGTVTHVGLFDAASAGNLRMWGVLGTAKLIGAGDTASFAIGALIVKLGKPGDTF